MIIYHGSNLTVKNPEILTPNRNLDFGCGFYTTTNREQALNFANKVTLRRKSGKSTVNIYELDESDLNKLDVLRFSKPDEQWLDFVLANRAGESMTKHYDLICGPVANDDVYQTFILYTSGVLTKEQTLSALKIKKLYNQYVFTSAEALKHLIFIDSFLGTEAF